MSGVNTNNDKHVSMMNIVFDKGGDYALDVLTVDGASQVFIIIATFAKKIFKLTRRLRLFTNKQS